MKKINLVFAGECVVIVALLFLIRSLLQTSEPQVFGKEAGTDIKEVTEIYEEVEPDSEEIVEYAKDILKQQEQQKEESSVSENSVEEEGIQVAIFGDSIWDDMREEDGISERLEERLGIKVYNCAIGGTSAAVISDPTDLREGWRSTSLNGLMYIARGEESSSILEGKPAREIIDQVDFNQVDYLIISYGLNDFFSQVEIYPEDMFDMTSYAGALRHAAAKMLETYPNMEVIITSPTYTEHFSDRVEDDLSAYSEAAGAVAKELGVYFWDIYYELGINAENQGVYLDDGVHLTAEGRALYADYVSQKLQEIEKENEE